jgi:type IV pilus assembly protein PilQ
MPKVLVGNNQQGTFTSVLQQPFATVNTGTATSTTTFGGTLDAGTIATVRPQIAAGDHLLLDYSVQLSSFVGASAGQGLPPPKQTNSVQSNVSIPDGYTVVVGGLELVTEADAQSRVPLIGGIPILGELFKNRTRNSSRDRFFVFIRANILRHNGYEDLKHLSAVDAGAADVDDPWPVSTPRVIR